MKVALESLPNYVRCVFFAFRDELTAWSQVLDHSIHPQLLISIALPRDSLCNTAPCCWLPLWWVQGNKETMNFPSLPTLWAIYLYQLRNMTLSPVRALHPTARLWQNTSFQRQLVNPHPQTQRAESADVASQKKSLFIWHFLSEVLEISHSYNTHLPKIKILSMVLMWLSDADP